MPTMDEHTHALLEELLQEVRVGNRQRIEGLLARGLVPNLCDSQGNSLLMLASYHGHNAMAKRLMQNGADPELPNERGQTPLAGAAFKGDLAMAITLLEQGADINGRTPGSKTPLMYAAMFDREDMVDLLLNCSADPTVVTREGQSAASLAEAMGAERSKAKLVAHSSFNQRPQNPAQSTRVQ